MGVYTVTAVFVRTITVSAGSNDAALRKAEDDGLLDVKHGQCPSISNWHAHEVVTPARKEK
jgi:hypothetical protein